MKNSLYILFVSFFICPGWAAYTYVIETYQSLPDLIGTQSMLITGQGGGGGFYANDYSSVTVESTSTLGDGTGGIWEINLVSYSHLDFFGGELRSLDMFNNATAILKGGRIDHIYSNQWVPYAPGRNGVSIPNIKLYYSGDLPTLNAGNILTGLWGNGDPFSIHLHDVPGYDPVIQNIQFILVPEPMTLTLFTLGTLLLRRKQN